MTLDTIKDRFLRISDSVRNTCITSGRGADEVNLIVVTKKQPVERIVQVIEAGATLLGENYPEEANEKIVRLPLELKPQWHMIGHIQSRKIKYLVRHFSFIHSIDRMSIALKLNQACTIENKVMPVLLEVNLTGEESKQGFLALSVAQINDLSRIVEDLISLKALKLSGLMTMPPFVNKPEENRTIFARSKVLFDHFENIYGAGYFNQLSMGTSQDYMVAIEEGATMVRVGEAIMGKRS